MGAIDRKEYLPGALNALTGAGIILLSLFVDLRFSLAREVARPVGLFTVYAGMALVGWAAFHLRGAFLGEVAPRLDVLVQGGPYRFMRHPVYLGMTVALIGVAVVTRSWPGLIGVLLLFLPGEIFRARLEEEALRSKFGSEWDDYAARTGFMLPRVGTGQKVRLERGPAAVIELAMLFLPGIPAVIWLWPNVQGAVWETAVQILAYVYMLAGTLWIGLRRWNLAELGFARKGLGLSLLCGLVLFAGRTLVILAVQWPRQPAPLTLTQVVGDLLFYFGLVAVVEEYIFRGLLYRALDEWRGARWAIWGSTAGFILFHIGWRSPLQLLSALIIGLIFAAIRWRAGSIVGLIFTHGLIDVGAVWMLPELRLEELGRPVIAHPGALLLGYALIVGIPLYLWLLHPRLTARNRTTIGGSFHP